jgi:hypothetical protein
MAALATVRRLDLGPRLVARLGRSRLADELGRGAAAALVADRGLAALAADRSLGVALELAQLATERGLPLALLKGAALLARGTLAPGSRALADLDLLVRESDLDAWARLLEGAGFAVTPGGVPSEHQLPTRVRGGMAVEIHRFLPGLRAPGRGSFAGFDSLESMGLLEQPGGWPAGVRVPKPGLLAAHAAVHGVAQHGFAPRSYPLMRMFADLVDLGAAARADDRARPLAGALSAAEWMELERACQGLVAGRAAGPLLAHAVFGALDDAYAASLRLRALGSVPSTLPLPAAWLREAWRALFPGRERIAALYPGEPAAAFKRPFRLLARALPGASAGRGRRH